MSRWDPDASGRLQAAAMELFTERGYDAVTVAEIAEHAGLKKRSFFRHYSDKREVLFAGSAAFERTVLDAVQAAQMSMTPLDAVMTGLAAGGASLTRWGEPVRERQRIVESAAELRERELIKMAALTTTVADALRDRGVDSLTATLTAQVGVAVFMTAFQQWVEGTGPLDLHPLLQDAVRRIRTTVCDPSPTADRPVAARQPSTRQRSQRAHTAR